MTVPTTALISPAAATVNAVKKRTPAAGRRLLAATRWLTTPLLPDDYLGLVNPLWSTRELRGRVEEVRPETRDTATLVLRPGPGWPDHRAGQYLRIGVDIAGIRHWRTFSLSSRPKRPDGRVSITVRALPDGLVSRHLVHETTPGTIVRLAPPAGEFVLPQAIPPRLLFLTAGSGITPVMAMLRDLAGRGTLPDVVLVHSARTAEDVIFGEELRTLAVRFRSFRLHEHHTRTGGTDRRITTRDLEHICPDWTDRLTWACGPAGLLDDVERHWDHAALSRQLRVERFRPPTTSGGTGGRVRFVRSGKEADADGSAPLLEVGEGAGVLMPHGCRMGICYSCVATLRSGRVHDLRTGREHGEEGELVQTCVSAAAGTVELDL